MARFLSHKNLVAFIEYGQDCAVVEIVDQTALGAHRPPRVVERYETAATGARVSAREALREAARRLSSEGTR